MKLNVLYEDNHLLVVEKPRNMPIQEDVSKDLDLLNEAKQYLINKYNKPGDAFLGLVHRLDRPVGGVVLFAKTSKAASRISMKFVYVVLIDDIWLWYGEFLRRKMTN